MTAILQNIETVFDKTTDIGTNGNSGAAVSRGGINTINRYYWILVMINITEKIGFLHEFLL